MQNQIAAQDRNWAMAAHLSALVAVAGLPFGHVLGPLLVYLIKGHESEFVGAHARASLNYQITISVFGVVAAIVVIVVAFGFVFANRAGSSTGEPTHAIAFVGFWTTVGILVLAVLLMTVAFITRGTLAASQGRTYSYPFAFRFLR